MGHTHNYEWRAGYLNKSADHVLSIKLFPTLINIARPNSRIFLIRRTSQYPLPQLAEANTPRSLDAAGEYYLYD